MAVILYIREPGPQDADPAPSRSCGATVERKRQGTAMDALIWLAAPSLALWILISEGLGALWGK